MPRDVIVLAIIAFCVAVGFGVLIPVLPVFAQSFENVTQLMVGMVISAFAFVRLLMSPAVGPLIRLMGPRTTLAVGIFIVAASSAASGFATTYAQLLIMRGLGGIGSAMFTVSAMSLLLGAVPSNMRGRAAGFFQSGFLIGGMAGPAVGGLLSQISLTAPFFFYAATLAVAGTVGLLLLRSGGLIEAGQGSESPRPLREVLRDARFQAACWANFANGWNSMGVRSSLTPVLVVNLLGRDPSWTGIAFAVSAVVQTVLIVPIGKFVDSVGRRPALIGGGLIATIGIGAVALAPNIWVLIAAMCVYAVGAGALGTAPAAAVGDAAGGRSGTPVAIFSMFSDVGGIIGPLVGGLIADVAGIREGYVLGAAMLLLTSLLALRMPPGVPTTTPTTEPDPEPGTAPQEER